MSLPALQIDQYLTPPLARHRISVEEYYRMGEAGLFAPETRTELIEGEIIDMPPIGSSHAGRTNRLSALMFAALGGRAIVSVQNPIRLGRYSEPQPDLAVLRQREDFYVDSHPTPADTLLVVEVADSTVRFDRGVKLPLYARHGVPECWLVDLTAGRVEVYRDPVGEEYRRMEIHRGGRLCLGLLPEVCIDLDPLGLTPPAATSS